MFNKGGKMKQEEMSTQDWLPIDKILQNGIIKLKNNSFVKNIKINPINFNLKSNLEKEAILNSYKTFLKTCNFDLQILIQSSKEDLNKIKNNIQANLKIENKKYLKEISEDYFKYIYKINSLKNSSSKNFYIIISNINKEELEENIIQDLNEKYFKIKECLFRCGNNAEDINNKKDVIKILNCFFNTRINLN